MNEFLIQKYSLFVDKQCKFLLDNIIEIVDGSFSNDTTLNLSKEPLEELEMLSNLSISEKLSCTVCNISLFDRDEQVSHYKSDLHRFNLKRKLNGLVSLTAEEFENLSELSSISGSDDGECNISEDELSISDTDDLKNDSQQNYSQIARNQPKIAFKLNDSNILVMHRCLLHGKKNNPENAEELINSAKQILIQDQWCIILVNAGHFASAIFRGEEIIFHKTFHRYVVRAKRGTVQSLHDKSGGHARSAGANIRRHHEAAFKEDIKSLMEQWKKELDKCKCIFLRAPKYNQQIFFSGKNSLFSKFDMRIRNIPFMTFRPTFNEIKRVHFILRTLELYNSCYLSSNKIEITNKNIAASEENEYSNELLLANNKKEIITSSDEEHNNSNSDNEFTNKIINTKKNKRKLRPLEKDEIKKQKESSPIQQKNLESNLQKIFNEFYSACITNDFIKLNSLFEKYNIKKNEGASNYDDIDLNTIINHQFDKNGFTLLHLASSLGYVECVKLLLLNGSDPTISTNDEKKVAYLLSRTKSVRDQFRRFMHDFPNLYDYNLAKIPSGLSLEKEIEKQNKEKEKRRLQRKLKKERDEESKNTQKQIQFENEDRLKYLALNEEEKRLLMIENKYLNSKNSKLKERDNLPVIKLNVKIETERIPLIVTRCWLCAENLSTTVPFEYFDYKFCSIKCLNSHRQKNKNKNESKT